MRASGGDMLPECTRERVPRSARFTPRARHSRVRLSLTPFWAGSTIAPKGFLLKSEGGVMGAAFDLPDDLTLAGRRLTRRDVLRYSFLSAAAVTVAAACGPSAAPAPPTAAPAAPTTAPAAKPTSAPAPATQPPA